MSHEPVYALSCAGGGAHGAYQVGVLKYVHEHFCRGEASPFQIFAGTSCGSLNTSFYASQSYDARAGSLWLEELWRGFHVPAYHGNVFKSALHTLLDDWKKPREERKPSWSLLDPGPMTDVIARGFLRENLERALELGTTLGIAVSATEVRSSRLVWFHEGRRQHSFNTVVALGAAQPVLPHHVEASCSVPYVFPPVLIDGHYYSDGGVANKYPLQPLVQLGATRLLSIATDRSLPRELPEYPEGYRPGLGDIAHMLTGQLSHDYVNEHARLLEAIRDGRRVAPAELDPEEGPVFRGTDVHPECLCDLEIKLFEPSRRIRGSEIYHHDPFDPEYHDKSTVLLFHKDFTRKLIDFGYADARARHDELAEFFDRDRPDAPVVL